MIIVEKIFMTVTYILIQQLRLKLSMEKLALSEEINPAIKAKFEEVVQRAKELPNQPPEVLLEMYGLYKQAVKGDVTGKRPGRIKIRE